MSVDPAAVMAEHYGDGIGCAAGCLTDWPCDAYRVAEALAAEQAKVARVAELAHRFEIVPRARLLGALTVRPNP